MINARFPQAGKRIFAVWGRPEAIMYLNDLIVDVKERVSGARQGFPPEVAMAMFKLSQKHDKAFPQFVAKDLDLWGGI